MQSGQKSVEAQDEDDFDLKEYLVRAPLLVSGLLSLFFPRISLLEFSSFRVGFRRRSASPSSFDSCIFAFYDCCHDSSIFSNLHIGSGAIRPRPRRSHGPRTRSTLRTSEECVPRACLQARRYPHFIFLPTMWPAVPDRCLKRFTNAL